MMGEGSGGVEVLETVPALVAPPDHERDLLGDLCLAGADDGAGEHTADAVLGVRLRDPVVEGVELAYLVEPPVEHVVLHVEEQGEVGGVDALEQLVGLVERQHVLGGDGDVVAAFGLAAQEQPPAGSARRWHPTR